VEIRQHTDLGTFAELAMPLLHADPVWHTTAVAVLAARLRGAVSDDFVTMLTVHENGTVRGAAMQTDRWPLITSALPPDAAPAVADALADGGQSPPGTSGPRGNAEAFAEAWCRRTGATARVAMALRQFELGELRPPGGVPGTARMAGMDDIGLLARWRREFAVAALAPRTPHPEKAGIARQLAAGQGNLLWEIGGEPVSLAVASVPVAGMSRIGPVWTPPEHRGHGYGSAATAAASRWALDAGAAHVVLFTDLANPVSNSIYPKIGYQPVHDVVDLAFDRQVD
jgi:RimJ/RimL family protein N-acetyltransferase